jgi:mycobactin lysine-N-oxygenase
VTLFTRGESFFENALFSDPTDWSLLTLDERRDAMARTDRGVFHAVGRDGRIRLTLSTNRGGEHIETVHGFDLVIDGSGADPLWFTDLFSQDALDLIELGLGGPLTGDALQESIGHDLAVTDVAPKLFLPNLSGLNQCPGFPNLSCLGLMSDRVLGAECW